MEAQRQRQRRSIPWRRVLLSLAALIALALIASALAGLFWLRGYQSLRQGATYGSNPGDGVMVQPPVGSDGTNVFFPRYRENGTFRVTASVANQGRFTITVLGPPKRPDPIDIGTPLLVDTEVAPPKRPSYYGSPLDAAHPIRIQPGDERDVIFVYKFIWRCIGGQPARYWKTGVIASFVSFRTVPLRVKYARWFEKTQNFTLPFAITLACRKAWLSPAAARAGLAG